MNALVTKIIVLTLLAATLGVILTLSPTLFVSKSDVVMKTLTFNDTERLEPPAIITATFVIVPGLIAGFLAFILTKKLGR
ncbi:MAG: hypothetical protein RMJ14_00840 [Nitrososphaerota archaeon]|nr:hypothetical protein [Aigarchaeota archaeon]MDW8076174.1 hypothetical protein [Nitrososphaerota archaeon]